MDEIGAMMNIALVRRYAFLFLLLVTLKAGAQNLPAMPPSLDPSFWGHLNKPYILKITLTSTGSDRTSPPKTREESVVRDSAGRVRTEDFYDNGQPSFVSIRDPNRHTYLQMSVVSKSAFTISLPRPVVPPPSNGWAVERLPSRIIAGLPAEGLRFTRTIPASADGHRAEDRVVEDDWISNELGLILEQRIDSQHFGTSTKRVSSMKQVEPDPALFSIPSDYKVQQTAKAVAP
jgi:hypothetical protein